MESQDSISRDEVLALLADVEQIWVRMALVMSGQRGLVHTLIAETLPPARQANAEPFYHDYGAAQFIGMTVSGREVASWIRTGSAELHPDGSDLIRPIQIPELSDGTISTRHASHHSDGYVNIPWPYTSYQFLFKLQHSAAQPRPGLLITQGEMFYPHFGAALLSLVYQMRDWQNASSLDTTPKVLFRFADMRGVLEHISISPTSVLVDLTGDSLPGCQLSVSGPPVVSNLQVVTGPGQYSAPLPGTLPVPLWIVLSNEHMWLDYYYRDTRWGSFGFAREDNVSLDLGNVITELEALVAAGEGPSTEFKEHIPNNHEQMLKTVAAFANGEGGGDSPGNT